MKGIVLAAITAVLWGVLAVALKVALNYFDSYTIVWFRFLTATFTLVVYYAFAKPSLLKVYKQPPRMMLLAAALLACNYIGFMQGIHYAGPAVAQIIIQTGPIILGILGVTVFKEKISLLRSLGFGIAALGFGVFYFSQLNETASGSAVFNVGVLCTFGAAVSWAAYAFLNKKLVRKYHPQQINLIIFGLPVLLFLPMVDFHSLSLSYEWWVWLLMIALGLNTVIAYGTLSAAFKYAEANRISIVIILNPVITFIVLELLLFLKVDYFAANEVSAAAYVGALLVLSGAILAVGMSSKKKT